MDGEDPNTTFCKVCKLNCRTVEKYAAHITTELHKKIALTRQTSGSAPPKAPAQEIPHVVEQVRPNRGAAAGGPASRGGNPRFGGPSGRGGIRATPPPPPLYNSFISSSGRGRGDYGMGHSGMGHSEMGQSGMGHSGMGHSEMGQSGMGHSGMGHSGMGQSGMGHSGMGHSGMGQSGMGQSGMGHSGMGHSGMGQSGMGHSGMGHSGMGRGDSGMGHSGRGRGDPGMGRSGRGRGNSGMGPPGRGGFGPGQRGGGASGKDYSSRGPPIKKSTAQSDDSAHTCDLCKITMSGPESYQQHITGLKHEKMLAEKGLAVEEKKVKQIRYQPGEVKIQAGINAIQSELVGLQYLVEFKHPTDPNKDPTYECFLCHARMDVRNVLAHITGFKHKHTYLKIHYADRIRWLDPTGTIATGPKIPEWKPFISKQVAIVAAAEGRAPVAVYEWDGIGKKPDVFTGAPPIKRPACLNQNLPEAKRQALEGISGPSVAVSKTTETMYQTQSIATSSTTATVSATAAKAGEASLLKLLGALKDYDIRSDSEADIIIKIKDALSASLQTYYKKSGKSSYGVESYHNSPAVNQTMAVQPTPPPPPPPPPSSWGSMSGAWPQNGNNTAMQGMYSYGYGDRTDFYGQGSMWY